MTHALWTSIATSELEDVLFYIRVEGGRPETARRIGEEIRELAVRHSTEHPPGHVHPAAPAGWFYFKHKRWLIFYQRHPEGIEVMRVVDAARDLPAALAERSPEING